MARWSNPLWDWAKRQPLPWPILLRSLAHRRLITRVERPLWPAEGHRYTAQATEAAQPKKTGPATRQAPDSWLGQQESSLAEYGRARGV